MKDILSAVGTLSFREGELLATYTDSAHSIIFIGDLEWFMYRKP